MTTRTFERRSPLRSVSVSGSPGGASSSLKNQGVVQALNAVFPKDRPPRSLAFFNLKNDAFPAPWRAGGAELRHPTAAGARNASKPGGGVMLGRLRDFMPDVAGGLDPCADRVLQLG
jgi:hypothetical protein